MTCHSDFGTKIGLFKYKEKPTTVADDKIFITEEGRTFLNMQGKADDEPKGRSTHTMFYHLTPKLKLNLLKLF